MSSPPGTGPDEASSLSRTSQAVAVTRMHFERPATTEGDPDAQARLCEGMPPNILSQRIPSLRARTTFFDEAVLVAIANGTAQVVILGAGYDDRALRFRSTGVHFIEIDHPATQTDKARRLATVAPADARPTVAPADFAHDDVGVALEQAGHDSDAPSLFIGEGLLAYLDQPTIVMLLGRLRARAATGSRLAVSLATHEAGIDSAALVAAGNAHRRTGTTEPWRTILPVDEHLALLTRSGWSIERVVDQDELEADAPAGRSMLVTATPADSFPT